ncbi:hypothetical protein N475_10220 [Pseudoalteromonas luteoviolacea DSM 6061]|uniref:Uncharacterized protein n=2 Tax=Pseudoalteromonas luteoviolacea TaxID=43657 RepID=A0A166YJI5_9GAMM|nr:hypothetical protein N475_10220 [Pseudoalteromonas luteoviolacea DSM 6061]MBE0385109.1 hypothetical protein [Pseudoalteromonas luteoviolacea DSM 6061]
MHRTAKTILFSLAVHLIVLFALSKQIIIAPQTATAPAMKTYLVIEDRKALTPPQTAQQTVHNDKTKAEPEPEPKNSSTLDAPVQLLEPAAPSLNNAPSTVVTNKQPSQSDFKKLDPLSGLERFKAQQAEANATVRMHKKSPHVHSSSRITVPNSHAADSFNIPKIETHNQIYTEYRKGDRCFKVMHGDPSSPVPEGFSNEWVSLGYKCNNVIKSSYEAVMNKWLDK